MPKNDDDDVSWAIRVLYRDKNGEEHEVNDTWIQERRPDRNVVIGALVPRGCTTLEVSTSKL